MKKLFLTVFVAVVALFMSAAPAHAGASVSVTIPIRDFAHVEVAGFHVTVQSGNGSQNPWYVSATKVSGGDAKMNQIAFTFRETLVSPGVMAQVGSSLTHGGTNGAQNNWTHAYGKGDASLGRVRFDAVANPSAWSDYGNPFGGVINLQGPNQPGGPVINYVTIDIWGYSATRGSLNNGPNGLPGDPGSGPQALVPEPGALAMLVPGLVPMLLAFRRRRRSAGKSDPVEQA
jgi:hypothetical protein